MKFEKVNFKTWERSSIFQHFINEMHCVMSMTVDIDITNFLESIHQKEYKFYPAMMWIVSSAVNNRKEFRMEYDEQGNI